MHGVPATLRGARVVMVVCSAIFFAPFRFQGVNADQAYPGTADARQVTVEARASALETDLLSADWASTVRPALLSACGLANNQFARPGNGYTGHCFDDFNHVDCCTMAGEEAYNENGGQVEGIHFSNQLGPGIVSSSLTELGSGGSWCTCELGSGESPPADVCHLQFKSRIGFKLVWCPGPAGSFETFTLVSDDGALLASGKPTGSLPSLRERRGNYRIVDGSKYAQACETAHIDDSFSAPRAESGAFDIL